MSDRFCREQEEELLIIDSSSGEISVEELRLVCWSVLGGGGDS